MYSTYLSPTTLDEALALKAQHGDHACILAGGTDLLLEMERGVRTAPDGGPLILIDLTRIPGLAEIREVDGVIQLGPLVTHNQAAASPLISAKALPLARASWEVGAPQIRNRATVAGNLITASPANDTIVPLIAMNASVTLASGERGERTLALADFITGFRKVDMRPDEILVGISFPALGENERGSFIKLGLRKAQAISVVSIAGIVAFTPSPAPSPGTGEGELLTVVSARISLGAVSAVIGRATEAEAFLAGKALTDEVIDQAAELALRSASPIDDIRAGADYRRGMVRSLTARLLRQLRDGTERDGWSGHPITLWGDTGGVWPVNPQLATRNSQLTTVNGQPVNLPGHMNLLDSLREAGFVGVKEGCAEGECGACTVFLDGMAVMACMVPAERAAGSEVVTVEGLGNIEQMHPVQDALVQSGGVQCGYCTPGFVMSGAKLLEERPHPSRAEAAEALTGNLCRCTGYRKILDAVVMAGEVG